MAAIETIALSSPPVAIATSRENSNEQHYIYESLHSDESLPSPSTLLKLAPRRPSRTGPVPVRSGSRSAELPSGNLGFSTASAFAKEHGLGSFKAIDLQQYTSREPSLQLVDTEAAEKPKAPKKRAAKKDAVPKLKLDKKPVERKSRKKKTEHVATALDDTVNKEWNAFIGDLQIFQYEGAKETYRETSLATKSPVEEVQNGDEGKTVEDSAGSKHGAMLADLQIFQYNGPNADIAEPVAVVGELKPIRTRSKKAQALEGTTRPQKSVVVDDLRIYEYGGVDAAGAEAVSEAPKAKPRKPRQKKETKDDQAQLPKPKITKPRGKAKTTTKSTVAEVIVVCDEYGLVDVPAQKGPENETSGDVLHEIEAELEQDLALDRAVSRRRDWTPPRDVTANHPDLNTESNEPGPTSELNDEESPEKLSTTFLNLSGNFGFNEQLAPNDYTRAPANTDEPALKKRRLSPVKSKVATKKATKAKQPKEPKARKEPKAPKTPKPPKVPRAPAKSSRTVTGIALAQYAPQSDVTAGNEPTIAAFFAKPDTEKSREEIGATAAAVAQVIKRKRSRSPAKRDGMEGRPKAKKATKRVTIPPQKLLSPAAAQKRLEHQDILFGTSSQLVREDSPTFIRQLQQAIKESESQVLSEEGRTESTVARGRRSLAIIQATKGHWLNGARGDEEMPLLPAEPPLHERRLLEAQSVRVNIIADNETLPAHVAVEGAVENQTDEAGKIDKPKASQVQAIVLISSDAFQDIDDVPDVPLAHGARSDVATIVPQLSSINKPRMLQDLSPNKKINARVTNIYDDKLPQSGQKLHSSTSLTQRPSNGPEQGDSAIISLDSSQRAPSPRKSTPRKLIVLADIDNARPTSPFQDIDDLLESSPPKPLARKSPTKRSTTSAAASKKPTKKAKTATIASALTTRPSSPYQDIDEIEDSEPELTSSPPRRLHSPATRNTLELSPSKSRNVNLITRTRQRTRSPSPTPTQGKAKAKAKAKKKATSIPKKATTITTTATDTTKSKPKPKAKPSPKAPKPTSEEESAHQALLFSLITKAITSAPPTQNGMQGLSWHEKMLMYDPIVLEDLAAWLNGSGVVLGLADGAGMGWMGEASVGESKEASAGGEARDGEGEEEEMIMSKKKKWEVKPAVLQKWCEENSVCCLWKGGLRGGVRARY